MDKDFVKELYRDLPWRNTNDVPTDYNVGIHDYLWIEEQKKNPKKHYWKFSLNFRDSYKDIRYE